MKKFNFIEKFFNKYLHASYLFVFFNWTINWQPGRIEQSSSKKEQSMPISPVSISMFTGIHNDPRLAGETVLFGLGSYVPQNIPLTLDYIYFVLSNNDCFSVILDEFFLQIGSDLSGRAVYDLDLPAKYLHNYKLPPGGCLGIGFLRDLFSAKLKNLPKVKNHFIFRAVCTLQNNISAISPPLHLSLNYPNGPVQDASLSPHYDFFARRMALYTSEISRIRKEYGSLRNYANLHTFLGMHKEKDASGKSFWLLREWAPGATDMWLTTDRLNFLRHEHCLFQRKNSEGLWELKLPLNELEHGTYMELRLISPLTGGKEVRRVPAFATRVEQNQNLQEEWCARVWNPPKKYIFKHDNRRKIPVFPRIYEAHIGLAKAMDNNEHSVGSFTDFTRNILPRIKKAGYTVVQLMGILEHPLYKSFGYQVSSYFAPSSRFGTPEDLCELIDTAHSLDLAVILDIAHSHAAPNTEQGIAQYDGSNYFFAEKKNQWGTVCFDYRLEMSRRFLLSNCRYWLEEYHVDGFRFDAVGNIIYVDNGFGDDFSQVERSFYTPDGRCRLDEAGILYLGLANQLIKEVCPTAISLAEEFSGHPGMTSPTDTGGLGFDYRFAMGIPDFWGKFIKENKDMGTMWYELTNSRSYECTISYVACHDQCINGKDAMIWRLIGDEMYTMMSCFTDSLKTSRGIALYKLMRLITLSTAKNGWLSFMGDEFGHPEWIDAEKYGHRQWHLTEEKHTRYAALAAFDRDLMLSIIQKNITDFARLPFLRHIHEADRTLAFERGNLLFAFNFHETTAQNSLNFFVTPGKYVEILSSDSSAYAGHGNLETCTTEHFSLPLFSPEPDPKFSAKFSSGKSRTEDIERISLYLPPLTGLVLCRE